MYQKVEIEIDIPDGYEFVRYDVPKNGDKILIGRTISIAYNYTKRMFIVRKVKQWREPVLPADYDKDARFSMDGKDRWSCDRLAGWHATRWVDSGDVLWKFCQVCDEETK